MGKRLIAGCLLVCLLLSGCGRQPDSRTDVQVSDAGAGNSDMTGTGSQESGERQETVSAFLDPDEDMEPVPDSYLQPVQMAGRVERFGYSTGDGKQKHAMVYLPYGYSQEQSYDVLYLMHGGGGSAEGVLGPEGGSNELTRILDHLIADGVMQPMIIVAPTFYPEGGADSSVSTAERLVKLFPEEWADDLAPALESHYATFLETADEAGLVATRGHRAFGGFSMGSVTTWYIFMEKLPYVSTFLPISGDCWAEGMQAGSSKPDETANALKNALEGSGYGANDFYIYAVTGTDDIAEPCMTPMLTAMRQLSDTFLFDTDRTGGNIRYRVKEGGSHDMTNVKQYLYHMLPELWPAGQDDVDTGQAVAYTEQALTLENNGQEIYGVAYIPQDGKEAHPLVICSHGLGGSYYNELDTAARLASWGLAAYCFDFRGGGGSASEGKMTDMSVMTEVSDLEAVLQAAQSWDFVEPERIVLLGDSQGGIVSAVTAARHKSEVAGVILSYPAFLVTDAVHERFASKEDIEDVYSFNWITAGRAYAEDMWDYDVYGEIGEYDKKVLLMHGDRDGIVPVSYSERAAEVYPAAEYFVIKGAGHGFSGRAFEEAMEHIRDYLQEIDIL